MLLTNHPLARRRHQWKPARPGPRDLHTRLREGNYCRNTGAPKAVRRHKHWRVSVPQRATVPECDTWNSNTDTLWEWAVPGPRSYLGLDSVRLLRRKAPFKYGRHRKAVTPRASLPVSEWLYILGAIETLAMFLKQLSLTPRSWANWCLLLLFFFKRADVSLA